MQIAVVAADFTPGEADQLRRSMAAWKRRVAWSHGASGCSSGMRRNGYTDEFAEQIYQQIRGFGEYGFPESHAASFALITYDLLLAQAPRACSVFRRAPQQSAHGLHQPAQLAQAARRDGVTVLPPDVLHSEWLCTLEPFAGQLAIRLGLCQIRSRTRRMPNA